MRRLGPVSIRFALALTVGALGFSSLAQAQRVTSASGMQIFGKVLAIDPAGKILRLETQRRVAVAPTVHVIDLAITPKTLVMKGGDEVPPGALEFGEYVQVEYAVENGLNVARSISSVNSYDIPPTR